MTLVDRLVEALEARRAGERLLVAVDGPDAAGKTTLADAVAVRMRRPVVRVSIDRWHHPREIRLRRGAESPEGYFYDSFDVAAMADQCLVPFRSGERAVTTGRFDHAGDRPCVETCEAAPDAVLLVDGVFLLRRELRPLWDMSIYVHASESVTLTRALVRDLEPFGSEEEVRHRYATRYLPGQALYLAIEAPLDAADVVVDNDDADRPVVVRWFAD